MNRESIEKLMQTAETKYNQLLQFKNEITAKLKEFGLLTMQEVDEEMARLQGDFRTLETIRQSLPTPPPVAIPPTPPNLNKVEIPSDASVNVDPPTSSTVSEPANTINAKPKESKDAKPKK